ncbi:hypothetical protein P4604_16980 [Lysinibacillus capsici]|uniref:hypothetical protein n=1 Tax=Lysinibacillus capsici TaxID=2115968 RepID=UPI002E1D9C8C|nr:hypothetical protein [Lysinibacillus capsici]
MNGLVLSLICFVKASLYGTLAMLIFVQIITGSELIEVLFSRTVLLLTFSISVLEMVVNIADIPQRLK